MYHDRTKPLTPPQPSYPKGVFSRAWLRRNLVWLALAGLVLVSLVMAMLQ